MDDLKPMTVNHENSKLYSMLKSCMRQNEELRRQIAEDQQQMLEAAETIENLTRELMLK
jgi:hypothetical protein